jgi:hypothetical protein
LIGLIQRRPAMAQRLFTSLNILRGRLGKADNVSEVSYLARSVSSLSGDKSTYSHYHRGQALDLSFRKAL